MNETISFEEIGLILALAAARDQRTVGDADGLAWHSDLNAAGVTYADADAALTRFYSIEMARLEPEHRRRVTTPDVIGIARKIRTERLANFIYEPPPGDSDPLYLDRLRGQIAAVADGGRPALTELPAIAGPPHASVARAIAGAFQSVPGADPAVAEVKRPGPLGAVCPKCKAPVGRPCRFGSGKERPAHPARVLASGGEVPGLADGATDATEIERRKAASRAALAALPPGAKPGPADGFEPAATTDFPKEA